MTSRLTPGAFSPGAIRATVATPDGVALRYRLVGYEQLTEELREKFKATTDYRKRLSLLTMSPYTIEETARYFGTSLYMARKSREVKESSGVLPDLEKSRKGSRISDENKDKVRRFYESDPVIQ